MSGFYDKYSEQSKRVGPGACSAGTVIGLAIPIAMIVMGAIHLENCPAERYIPIYLIVSGCFTIAVALIRVAGNWMQDEEGRKPKAIESFSGIISLFLFAWFIAGSVWIFRLYNKYNPEDITAPNYCDNTFYLFAFWVTIFSYIFLGLSILIGCCACICACLCGKKE